MKSVSKSRINLLASEWRLLEKIKGYSVSVDHVTYVRLIFLDLAVIKEFAP